MKLSDVMGSARLKVKRAYRHIDELVQDTTVLPAHMYEIYSGPARSHALLLQPDCYRLDYQPREEIAKHFGSVMGDAVNNLREAMDYWVNAAAACVGPRKKLHFPFAAERKDLETSRFYPAIQKTFPAAAQFIATDIQPCRDTNLYLWAATSLCNDNKHNDFLPCVAIADLHGADIRSGTNLVRLGSIATDADKIARIIESQWPITGYEKLRLACEVTFPKGAIFEDQPVVPTLTNMAEVVSQTLDALETFIKPYCR